MEKDFELRVIYPNRECDCESYYSTFEEAVRSMNSLFLDECEDLDSFFERPIRFVISSSSADHFYQPNYSRRKLAIKAVVYY